MLFLGINSDKGADGMIDLHVHSNVSDGTLTPAQVVGLAARIGLKAMALTDHDTVKGIGEAQREAGKYPLELIPGIEISAWYHKREIHILGLYVDDKNEDFTAQLDEWKQGRSRRNEEMLDRFAQIGLPIPREDFFKEFPGEVITRAHFARYLLNHGFVSSMDEAFARYVGDGCPCYVPKRRVEPKEALAVIRRAGGVSVLAHPMLYRMNQAEVEELVKLLKEQGLDGIEGIYSTYSKKEEEFVCSLARKYDLLITGGSDFHGSNKPSISLGVGKGDLSVPDSILPCLKACRDNFKGCAKKHL